MIRLTLFYSFQVKKIAEMGDETCNNKFEMLNKKALNLRNPKYLTGIAAGLIGDFFYALLTNLSQLAGNICNMRRFIAFATKRLWGQL